MNHLDGQNKTINTNLGLLKVKRSACAKKCLKSKILLGVVLFQDPFDKYQYLLFVMCRIRFFVKIDAI